MPLIGVRRGDLNSSLLVWKWKCEWYLNVGNLCITSMMGATNELHPPHGLGCLSDAPHAIFGPGTGCTVSTFLFRVCGIEGFKGRTKLGSMISLPGNPSSFRNKLCIISTLSLANRRDVALTPAESQVPIRMYVRHSRRVILISYGGAGANMASTK